MDIPQDLVESIAVGDAALFIGAGLSMGADLPGWSDLLMPLADQIGLPPHRRNDLLQIAQDYENLQGRHSLLQHILRQTDTTGIAPTLNHRRLASLGIATWITTNYDDLLEHCLRDAKLRFRTVVQDEDVSYTTSGAITLVKMHGDRTRPKTIIITKNDYDEYPLAFPIVQTKLRNLVAERTLLFLGYSVNDPDFNRLRAEVFYHLNQHQRNAFAVLFDADQFTMTDLNARRIRVINLHLADQITRDELLGQFLDTLIERVSDARQTLVVPANDLPTPEAATPNELDPTAIRWEEYDDSAVKRFLGYCREVSIDVSNPADLLEQLKGWNLVCESNGAWVFTRVGALLFGPHDRTLPYGFTDTRLDFPSGEMRSFPGYPLMQQLFILQDELAYLWEGTREDPSTRDAAGRPIVRSAYPRTALVEALVNFFIHRDYATNEMARITIHTDRVELSNPGYSHYDADTMLSEKVLDDPWNRNPHLVTIAFRARLNQRQGGGLRRIIQSLRENGNLFPDGSPAIEIRNDKEQNRFKLIMYERQLENQVLPTRDETLAYLRDIQTAYSRWADRPDGPEPPLAQGSDAPLGPDAFIELQARPLRMRVSPFQAGPKEAGPPPQDLLAALTGVRRAIILGEPGSGKTTALERLAWSLAGRGLAQPPNQPLTLPILASLADYRGQEDLLALLDQALKLHGLYPADEASLRAWLKSEQVQPVLLLDGLSEFRQALRTQGEDAVRGHAVDFPGHVVYLTCRMADFDAAAQAEPALQVLPQAQIWTVEPLVDDIRYWDDHEGDSDVRDYLRLYLGAADGKRLWDRIHADDRLRTLARLPLFLWMIKESGASGGELPADRGGLVQRFVRSPRVWARTPLALRERAERGLELLGWRLQELGSLVIDGDELDAVLESAAGRRATLVELDAALRSTGLLIDQHDGTHRLLHQLIQEYAAAAYLARLQDCPERLAALAQDETWRETAIMALWLRTDLHTPVYLQGLMGEPAVDLRVRIAAATILAQVGDPRFGRRSYQVRARSGDPTMHTVQAIEPAMVTIPAGLALLGGEDPDADSDELPQSQVQIAAFELAMYPVTNAEYACFLEAGGYQEPQWWLPDGQAWLRGKSQLDPETEQTLRTTHRVLRQDIEAWMAKQRQVLSVSEEQADAWRIIATKLSEDDYIELYVRQVLGERRQEPIRWRDSRFNLPSQPVVGINWHEAVAYAAWLAADTGKAYRLPTEADWEWAARRNVRRYPWGNDWDLTRCNTMASGLDAPNPVGIYPHGASVDGEIQDLAGNVYEWTASLYRPYPYDPADGREGLTADGFRVMRGGSWNTSRTYVRCAHRRGGNPLERQNHLGFRLARSLP